MSCTQSPVSGESDGCEPIMGDVLGKEGTEDQLSDQIGESIQREEAEGAEAHEEISINEKKVSPEPDLDPGEKEQFQSAKEDQQPATTETEVIKDVCQADGDEHEGTACPISSVTNESSSIPVAETVDVSSDINHKSKDERSNSDVGVYDVEESESDIEGVADADDEDGYEDDDDDDYEDYDDDEEGGMDADDEDDFAENEIPDQSPRMTDSLDVDELQSKRNEEIKVNSDCVYSYYDSSDDSALRTKSKSGGRICDSMRRRKLTKTKECAPSRSNIPGQIDQTAMLSEAMTNLKLDNERLEICDGNDNNIIKSVSGEIIYGERIPGGLLTSQDQLVPDTLSMEASIRPVKLEETMQNQDEHTSLNDIKELMRKSCTCESCESKRITLSEQSKLQDAWTKLRHFVREVYRIIMQTAPDDCLPIVDSSQDEEMIAIAKRLTQSDPHQLYHRLQAQVHEVATAVKVKLKDISEDHHQDSLVATDFFEGLFYCYDKVSAAAKRVAPILEDLESKHLSRFNLTWELLNKAIYFQVVYNDGAISQKLPEMISLVSDKGAEFTGMIRFYMAFDDEMCIIQAMWRESFELLQKYNTNQLKIRAKQQLLLRDWEIFKAQRKRVKKSSIEGFELSNRHGTMENGLDPDEFIEVVVCPSCNTFQPCPCDECCLSHLFACRAHQARIADLSPTLERMAADGAGDAPEIIGSEDRHGYGILRSAYGPTYHVPAELHPPPPRPTPKPCPFGCYCNSVDEHGVALSNGPEFPEQHGGHGDGYPHTHLHSMDPPHPHLRLSQTTAPNNCQITDLRCINQNAANQLVDTDMQHVNGAFKNDLTAGSNVLGVNFKASTSCAIDRQSAPVRAQHQPRACFTAGPGVNVPDTDNFPDASADFPIDFSSSPAEFSGEVKVGTALKPNEQGQSVSKTVSKNSFTPVSPGTKIGTLTANGQDPIFVLTKAGAGPPPNIPVFQGKTLAPKENRLSSSVPCTPPTTPPSNKSGPTIQGLLEEALERKKAEMARAATTPALRDPPNSVVPTATTDTAAAPTATQAKPKLGHTCSSAKHKQHTHSPSHRDPKNCDCCFCEMFGHGAPPAAPTSHRFHENRQRLRSKLNKSRASKQQTAGHRHSGTAKTVAASSAASSIAPVRPAAAQPDGAAAPTASKIVPSGPKVAVSAAVAGGTARPQTVGAPAAASSPAASLVVKTPVPGSTSVATVTRTVAMTAATRVTAPAGVPAAATPTGAAAARAMAYNATSGGNSAFVSAVGKSQTLGSSGQASAQASAQASQAQAVRPSHVTAAKIAEAGISKTKVQPVSSPKTTVTSSNQRIVHPSACVGQGNQAPSRGIPQATQTTAPPKKVVTPAPAPAPSVPTEERAKKDDRPIDELLDFIEGSSSSQPKTADSKKAAKKARQKQKKLELQREEEMVQTPDVTITMLKETDPKGKGKKGSNKRTEEVISTIPSATAQSIRDRIKSQVASEVAKKIVTSDQPQMVTIRRVMEPNSSEPTVTITLKGATPDKDKVLFTLVNGQNEVVCHDQVGTAPKSKKQRKLERRLLRQQQLQQIEVEEGVEEDEDYVEEEEEEEIDMSSLTKTQRKKLRRLQRKQEEERLAEEQRLQEEQERQRKEEEKRKKEEEERLLQQRIKKNGKEKKLSKAQSQPTPQTSTKKNQKTNKTPLVPEQSGKQVKQAVTKGSKVNSAPDSDEEFIVPVQMTKKERKKARKVQQLLEEEQKRQRQKEEEEKEKQRQQELKEQKKKQKELQKLKLQQQKQQEKLQQKQKEAEKKQQQQQKQMQQKSQPSQQQQSQKQKQKQTANKQQQNTQNAPSKRGGRITTSIIPNPLTLGSYMPPVGSLEWTTQNLAASRPSVTIQPASANSGPSSLGGLEQRFSTTLTLNGKPILPPPRLVSPEPAQDFSLENLKLPPGITITKVDPSQVSQRKPPVSKPQVTKTVVPNPPPTTIIAAPLSGSRPPGNYNSGGGQDPNSNVIVVDTGKLKQDIAKREEEPEQVVSRKKKNNNKNRKGLEPVTKGQASPQLTPYLYGMNSVSITPAGQPPAPTAPQAAIIKMNGNMVTIRNPAIHPTPQRYVGPDESAGRKSVPNSGPPVHLNRSKDTNPLPPRFANAKLAQQTNGYVPEFSSSNQRAQHYNPPLAPHSSHSGHPPQTIEVSKPPRHHYETPSRHFESQPSHYEGQPHRHFEPTTRPFDGGPRQHCDHPGRKVESHTRQFDHTQRHYDSPAHHFDHPGHLFNPPPSQQMTAPTKHVVPQNYAAAIEGKKSKLKSSYNNDDWQLLDNVFAPKDIDLDDGDIDDDERELEAFKRFCLQSVPPKRKEKVHLNIEDIVLKKKSSPVSCT